MALPNDNLYTDQCAAIIAAIVFAIIISRYIRANVRYYRKTVIPALLLTVLVTCPFSAFLATCLSVWTLVATVSLFQQDSLIKALDTILIQVFNCAPDEEPAMDAGANVLAVADSASKAAATTAASAGVKDQRPSGFAALQADLARIGRVVEAVKQFFSRLFKGHGALANAPVPKNQATLVVHQRALGIARNNIVDTLRRLAGGSSTIRSIVTFNASKYPKIATTIDALSNQMGLLPQVSKSELTPLYFSDIYVVRGTPSSRGTLHMLIAGNPHDPENYGLLTMKSSSSNSMAASHPASDIVLIVPSSYSSLVVTSLTDTQAAGCLGQATQIDPTYFLVPSSVAKGCAPEIAAKLDNNNALVTVRADGSTITISPRVARIYYALSVATQLDATYANMLISLAKVVSNIAADTTIRSSFVLGSLAGAVPTVSFDTPAASFPLVAHYVWHCCLALDQLSRQTNSFADSSPAQLTLAILSICAKIDVAAGRDHERSIPSRVIAHLAEQILNPRGPKWPETFQLGEGLIQLVALDAIATPTASPSSNSTSVGVYDQPSNSTGVGAQSSNAASPSDAAFHCSCDLCAAVHISRSDQENPHASRIAMKLAKAFPFQPLCAALRAAIRFADKSENSPTLFSRDAIALYLQILYSLPTTHSPGFDSLFKLLVTSTRTSQNPFNSLTNTERNRLRQLLIARMETEMPSDEGSLDPASPSLTPQEISQVLVGLESTKNPELLPVQPAEVRSSDHSRQAQVQVQGQTQARQSSESPDAVRRDISSNEVSAGIPRANTTSSPSTHLPIIDATLAERLESQSATQSRRGARVRTATTGNIRERSDADESSDASASAATANETDASDPLSPEEQQPSRPRRTTRAARRQG